MPSKYNGVKQKSAPTSATNGDSSRQLSDHLMIGFTIIWELKSCTVDR